MSSGNLDEAPMNLPGKLSLSLACEKQATVKHSISFKMSSGKLDEVPMNLPGKLSLSLAF